MEKRFSLFFPPFTHALHFVELVFYAFFLCSLWRFRGSKRKWSFFKDRSSTSAFLNWISYVYLHSIIVFYCAKFHFFAFSLSLGAFNYCCCAWNYHFLNTCRGELRGKKGWKKVSTCMTSTISTAHRSQHLIQRGWCGKCFMCFLLSFSAVQVRQLLLTVNNQHDPLGYTWWNTVL